MGGLPDIVFIIDTNKESIAVQESRKLGIPVVAVVDSNSNPDGITYQIPGNDDLLRAIHMYCDLIAGSVLDGLQEELMKSGGDAGAAAQAPTKEMGAAEPEMKEGDGAPAAN